MAEPMVAAITWTHDSRPTKVVRTDPTGRQTLERFRVLVNNRGAAYLQDSTTGEYRERLTAAGVIDLGDGKWQTDGLDPEGVAVTYTYTTPVIKTGCQSCHG